MHTYITIYALFQATAMPHTYAHIKICTTNNEIHNMISMDQGSSQWLFTPSQVASSINRRTWKHWFSLYPHSITNNTTQLLVLQWFTLCLSIGFKLSTSRISIHNYYKLVINGHLYVATVSIFTGIVPL